VNRASSLFERLEAAGLVILLVGLPLSEALKSLGLGLALLGYVGRAAISARPPSVGRRGPALALAVYLAVAALSVIHAAPGLRRPGDLFVLGMTVAPFFLVADVCSLAGRRRMLAFAVATGCAVAALDGYIGFMTGHEYRLSLGSIENAVPAAEYLGASLAFVAALIIVEVGSPLAGPLLALACGAAAISLFLTRSRGPMFGAAAGVALVLAAALRRRVYAALLLLTIVVAAAWFAVANPESRMSGGTFLDSDSASFRLSTWRAAAELITERPFLGHGLGTFAELGVTFRNSEGRVAVENAHSTWVHAATETGLVGAGALTLFLVLGMMTIAASLGKQDAAGRAISIGALGAVVALAIAGIFSVTIDAEPGMLFFALMALGQRPVPAGARRKD
jgi:O-antigen ligase